MPTPLFVEKTLQISASAQLIWRVLTESEITKQWVSEFGINGGKINSEWQKDSEVNWQDHSDKTIVTGKIITVDQPNHLHFSVIDVQHGPMPGTTDADGITYQLAEANGKTTLSVKQGDFGKMPDGSKYHAATENIWDKVLTKIKILAEQMQKISDQGYQQIRVCPLPPAEDLGEHTHDLKTVHLILNGQLTITESNQSQTYQTGDYIEFPANTTHKAQGTEGGQMIVAF